MQRHYNNNHHGSLAKQLFRSAELFGALQILSWTTLFTRLPFAVKISAADYLWKLFTVIASPLFAFILCNGIIVYLIAKSSATFSSQRNNTSANNVVQAQLYDYEEIIIEEKNNNNNNSQRAISWSESEAAPESHDETSSSRMISSSIEEDVNVYQDKQIIISEMSTCNIKNYEADTDADSDPDSCHPKAYGRRTLSDKSSRECCVKKHGELRRSKKDKLSEYYDVE
ncbi:hypothetical protein FEM48_Zijuj10G0006500 [Ziziphus jujuba var. spinosa]|uniref:Uncharacterized protein n=1 Tax=Ziziphus jujuba var. spinosa TaxID=714518 RepID=A0A978UK94_ZIZJJ|nr:hypothetical protein FEM48_Zijuj10G0006500 [Ziziphus jujuba var. spinosa]